MDRTKMIKKFDELCRATVCYSCNFTNVCGKIHTAEELSDEILERIVANGNRPGAGLVYLEEARDDADETV